MTEYEKAVQAMEWLCKNLITHCVDDETNQFTKSKGGMFFVRIESSVYGAELIEMAKELGWKGE